MALNNVNLMGRMTRDPEIRHTNSGTPVASFTLAVERDFKNSNGEKETDFIDCTAWRNTADFVGRYFGKGRMAVVSGRMQIRKWTDKDGNKRIAPEVVAEHIYFGDSKKDDANEYAPQTATKAATSAPQNDYSANGFDADENDDEFPF